VHYWRYCCLESEHKHTNKIKQSFPFFSFKK
jgi:hypothetical protein